jgi:peptidoglycan/LPS O-acetylase OafA/YrhL
MVLLILLSTWANLERYPNAILFATFLALPSLFHFQQLHPFDSWVGELSYPVYVGHWLVLGLASEVRSFAGPARHNQVLFSVAEVIGTLLFAYLLKRLVADPVEVARRAIRKRAAPIDAVIESPERVRL